MSLEPADFVSLRNAGWRGLPPLILASLALLALCLGLAWARGSILFGLGMLALATLGLLRPQLGALALIALASVDLLGTVEVVRFTVRASQIAALATCTGLLLQKLRQRRLLHDLAQLPIAIWLFAAFAALAALRLLLLGVANPLKGYGYAAWALFDALAITATLAVLIDHREYLDRALRTWVLALTAIAGFGLLQWTMGLAGFQPPLVTQWMGNLPRINGLSYEPSYFAFSTSVGIALVIVALVRRPSFLAPLPAALSGAVLVVAMALSSSRSGWIGLLFLTVALLAQVVSRRRQLDRARWQGLGVLAAGYLVAAALLLGVGADRYGEMARKGLDIEEHSSSAPRLEGVRFALDMFADHPVAGVGLGQFGAVLAGQRAAPLTPEQVDSMVTFNLYAELAAENGLLGLLLMLAKIFLCARAAWQAWRDPSPGHAAAGGALLLAGALLFGIMAQFNQTLFRTDVWCLLGLCLAAGRLSREGECG